MSTECEGCPSAAGDLTCIPCRWKRTPENEKRVDGKGNRERVPKIAKDGDYGDWNGVGEKSIGKRKEGLGEGDDVVGTVECR